MKTLSEQQALQKAASYCSLTEHCISEVKEKLTKWGVENTASERIIAYLIKEGFINEKRFVKSFVNDKLTFNKWGKVKIGHALQQKKINPSDIDKALESIDKEKYSSILQTILKDKMKSIKYKDPYELQGKLFRFALSRGFSSNEIQSSIKNMLKDEK
ncbi:MAG: RecX family transcriptional regulator [Candidatus Azobacteroides sp.]|nr:RecX family transcriptional regulator [Candidatus Azobacteroides sp.]